MQKRVWTLAVPLIAVGIIASCDDDDSTGPDNRITYLAVLTAPNEVSSTGAGLNVNSTGTGTWVGKLDPSTNVLSWDAKFSGLGTNVTLGHIHGPAATNTTASVIVDFNQPAEGRTLTTGATSGTATGSVSLAGVVNAGRNISGDSLRKLLDAGLTYANIHTSTYGGGEIRGQILRQP